MFTAFFKGALPWLMAGVALAYFFAYQKELKDTYARECLLLGCMLGILLGFLGIFNVGFMSGLGMLLGVLFGKYIKRK